VWCSSSFFNFPIPSYSSGLPIIAEVHFPHSVSTKLSPVLLTTETHCTSYHIHSPSGSPSLIKQIWFIKLLLKRQLGNLKGINTHIITHLLAYLLTFLITYLITHTHTYLLTHLLAYFLTHLLNYTHTYLLSYSLTCLFSYSLTYLHTYLLTYSLTYFFTHLLTYIHT